MGLNMVKTVSLPFLMATNLKGNLRKTSSRMVLTNPSAESTIRVVLEMD